MPKLPTHWIFAEEVYRRMPHHWQIRRAVDRYRYVYRYGSVAPDTPFYLHWGPGSGILNRHAEEFHEKGGGLERFLATALSKPGGNKTEPQLAFAAGVLTHAAADTVFHPMIYYFSGSGMLQAEWRHHRMEGFIDLYFSRNFSKAVAVRLEQVLQGMEVNTDTLLGWLADLFDLDRRAYRPCLRASLWWNEFFLNLFIHRGARLLADRFAPGAPDGLRQYLAHFYPYRLPDPKRLFPNPITYRNPATGQWFEMRIEEMGDAVVDASLDILKKVEAGGYRIAAMFPDGWNLHTGIADRPKSAMCFFDAGRPLREILGVEPGQA